MEIRAGPRKVWVALVALAVEKTDEGGSGVVMVAAAVVVAVAEEEALASAAAAPKFRTKMRNRAQRHAGIKFTHKK